MFTMLVIATKNKNKLREFQEILKDLEIEIVSLDAFGPIPPVIEDGDTFEENAYKKALHTAKILGLPALADDSGLAVEALSGQPGVYSARFSGENASDEENCHKLLNALIGEKNRKARFHCVLSLAVPSGPALTYVGQCDGVIIDDKRGNNGFGYDPIFYFEELGKTFAELSMEEKSRVSHRGKALAEMKNELESIKKWVENRLAEERPAKPDHSVFLGKDWSDEL
ncbi:XTP/dITP diphosphatase [Candidatus Roizmanbacteria bacterium]|jgi:XTP/dITP diphosphohydrolase|nr:XTP/dITP diphosphatase [Candidatus Roizmanbacteria bacterium]